MTTLFLHQNYIFALLYSTDSTPNHFIINDGLEFYATNVTYQLIQLAVEPIDGLATSEHISCITLQTQFFFIFGVTFKRMM